MNTITLSGCAPSPLASYLKALGVLRLLARQYPESNPRGCWKGNEFVVTCSVPTASITEFFLHRYSPSPIVAPWNGGSGFYPKDNSTALDAVGSSATSRFAPYRETIHLAREAITALGLKEKPEPGQKERMLLLCRNSFPEGALEWLDSAFVLTADGPKYPPLLGTGGNDGRLEFTNNFMQRVIEIIAPDSGAPAEAAERFLVAALFDVPVKGLADNPIGQFSPASSGGSNASTGFGAKSTVNPWDYVLALEGAMLFAAANVKRLESAASGQLAYPFCVQPCAAGYSSAAATDESEARCEIWMPLWTRPSGLDELRSLLGEGRAWVGGRPAKNGLDFARAVASLGVERGIAEFQRYSFQVRNGLAYFATPLQRLRVHRNVVIADLLADADGWISRFLSKRKPEAAPASICRAARRLEAAIIAQTAAGQRDNPETAQELLIALGECERILADSERWRTEASIPPIPHLRGRWVKAVDNGTREFRLAASLASLGAWFGQEFYSARRHLEPVKVVPGPKGWVSWAPSAETEVAWNEGELTGFLCGMMKRRLLLAKKAGMKCWPDYGRFTAWPADVAAFIEGRIDEKRFAQLLWGLSLVDFSVDFNDAPSRPPSNALEDLPPAFYAQLKLCYSLLPNKHTVPVEPAIFMLAANGEGERASRQALRRLHGSSIPVTHVVIPLSNGAAQRSAAALLFPLWDSQLAAVGRIVAPELFPPSTRLTKTTTN